MTPEYLQFCGWRRISVWFVFLEWTVNWNSIVEIMQDAFHAKVWFYFFLGYNWFSLSVVPVFSPVGESSGACGFNISSNDWVLNFVKKENSLENESINLQWVWGKLIEVRKSVSHLMVDMRLWDLWTLETRGLAWVLATAFWRGMTQPWIRTMTIKCQSFNHILGTQLTAVLMYRCGSNSSNITSFRGASD